MRKALVVVATLAVGACSLQNAARPRPGYSDTNFPESDTAIFSPFAVLRSGSRPTEDANALIIAVDGDGTGCPFKRCPVAIRVKPGEHRFTLRYNVYNNGLFSYLTTVVDVNVANMQRMHVYGVRVAEGDGVLRVAPIDLGIGNDYGIYLGLKGLNQNFYPFSFTN
jgi:hypothetical protein